MAGIGLPCVWVGDGRTYGGKVTTAGEQYAGVIAASPSPGAAVADVSAVVGGSTVLVAGAYQAVVGPTYGGIPLAQQPGSFAIVA